MEKVFSIPQGEVKGIVRSVLNQKIISVILGLLLSTIVLFSNKQNSNFGIKTLTPFENYLVIYSFLILLCTGLLIIARRGFTRLYNSFQITITDQGIERD